jgi:hypothetical protein
MKTQMKYLISRGLSICLILVYVLMVVFQSQLYVYAFDTYESKESTYEGENYRITSQIASKWSGGAILNFEIENTGLEDIENWYLRMNRHYDVQSIWNASVSESDDSTSMVIENVNWNSNLKHGEKLQFGMKINTSEEVDIPDQYSICTERVSAADRLEVRYESKNQWPGSESGILYVSNQTDEVIAGWDVEIESTNKITNIWNGSVKSETVNSVNKTYTYKIKSESWNRRIPAGETVEIGLVCRWKRRLL